ncbi:MAG: cytochrome c [Paludibacterium sp.]|uniref:c-type cytochrome n=1 Tax=Paludibacterium sp. TaxID=1917523 RepID=UPI0025DC829D|nr:cytochrome c [Paludibacterium sp.]MBV8047121.1 cytochrome c [Paludibacterium sp.]MBV8648748.1 cytochrome c [Paludibacterium sp.]
MNKSVLIAALLLATASAFAAGPASERRAVFKHYKQALGSMNKQLNAGNFDRAQFAAAAKSLAAEAHAPWQYFPADSKTSDTRSEIWSNPQGFKQASDDFEGKVSKLNQLAAAADVALVRAGFREVQQSCKACHDKFRN